MNRRHFIVYALTIAVSSLLVAGDNEPLPKSSSYRIVQIDPRLITKTNDTYAVGWEKRHSDVMGSVYLSHDESVKFKTMLNTALTPSENVPACGHSPAYVIVLMDSGRAVSFVSICGFCKTWCDSNGKLRALNDSEIMPFLTKILPLPPAFSKVKELPDLWKMDPKKSFLELPSPVP